MYVDYQGQYDRRGRPDQYGNNDLDEEDGMLSDERSFNRDRRMGEYNDSSVGRPRDRDEYNDSSIGRPRDRERDRSDRDRSGDQDRKRRRSEEKSR